MILSINKMLKSVPVLICRDPEYCDEFPELNNEPLNGSVPFVSLNPTIAQPRVKGVLYGYTLLDLASDILCPIELIEKFPGINSKSGRYSRDGASVECTYEGMKALIDDFFSRSNGLLEPSITARINRIGAGGLENFATFMKSTAKSMESVVKQKTDKIATKLYSNFYEA